MSQQLPVGRPSLPERLWRSLRRAAAREWIDTRPAVLLALFYIGLVLFCVLLWAGLFEVLDVPGLTEARKPGEST
jgi:hypothetical protein